MSWYGQRVRGLNNPTIVSGQARGRRITVATPERLSKMIADLDGLGAGSGSQLVRGVVYEGDPATRNLVAHTEPFEVPANMARRWVDLPFLAEYMGKLINPADYWIGLQTGPDSGVLRMWGQVAQSNSLINPSFKTSVNRWATYQPGTDTGALTWSQDVLGHLGKAGIGKLTADATGQAYLGAVTGGADRINVSPGQTVTCFGYSYALTTSRQSAMIVVWYDAGGVIIGGGVNGALAFNTVGAWSKCPTHAPVAPPLAAKAAIYQYVSGPGANEVHYVDDILASLNTSPPTTYEDGDSEGWLWAGPPHDSTSGNGFTYTDAFEDGPLPQRSSAPGLSIQPGVALQTSDDWQPSSILVPDLSYSRLAFPTAQAVFAADVPLSRSQQFGSCEWYGVRLDPESGANAIVRSDGPMADLVGERLRVTDIASGREVNVYCHSENPEVVTDIALSKRAFESLNYLALESIDVLVEVLVSSG